MTCQTTTMAAAMEKITNYNQERDDRQGVRGERALAASVIRLALDDLYRSDILAESAHEFLTSDNIWFEMLDMPPLQGELSDLQKRFNDAIGRRSGMNERNFNKGSFINDENTPEAPAKIPQQIRKQVRELFAKGVSGPKIAEKFGISFASVYKINSRGSI